MNESTSNKVRNIIIFTVLVNVLAWLGPVIGGDPLNPGPGVLLWGIAPIAAALFMKFVLRDKVQLGFKPKFASNRIWYALSILGYPAIIMVTLLLGIATGTITLNDGLNASTLVAAMIPLTITYLIFGVFEEVGWRGYLAPKMFSVTDTLWGHVWVGVIWASWHFPYMQELWAHTTESMVTLLPRFILGTIILSVVYGEIRIRTGSVIPAILMHWLGNTLANTLLIGNAGEGIVAINQSWMWLASFGVTGVLNMVIFAIIGGTLFIRRRRKQILLNVTDS